MNRVRRGRRLCFVQSCRRSERNVSSLHEFPSDPTLREKWFESLSLPKEIRENLPDKALICNEHFSKDAYRTTPSGRKLLKREALPKVYLDTNNSENTPEVPMFEFVELTHYVKTEDNYFNDLPPTNLTPDIPSTRSISTETVPEIKPTVTDKNFQVDIIKLDDIHRCKYEIKLLKQRIKRLNEKNLVLNDSVQEMDKIINHPYHQALLKIKKDSESNNTHATFLLDQISNYGKQKPRFSKLSISNCIAWRRRFPRGYKYCRSNLLKLPSIGALNRHSSENTEKCKIFADIQHPD